MENERLAALEQEHAELAEKIAALQKKAGPRKDFWDIISATTPLITGLLISGIGLYFAYTNNQAQLKLQETQTVGQFIPHLIGSEPEKKAAIIALSTITDTQTAAKYAELFPSEGTASALKSIASSTNAKDSDRKVATRALANTFHQMADTYQANQNSPAAEQAYTQSISAEEKLVGKNSPELVENLDRLSETYKTQRKYNLAEDALRRASTIQEKTYGSRSPQFIASINKLAQVLKLEGKPDAATHLTDYAELLAQQIANHAADANKASDNQIISTADQSAQQDKQSATTSNEIVQGEVKSKSDSFDKHNIDESVSPNASATSTSSAGLPTPAPVKDTASLSNADNSQKPTL